ncbi:MAG: hypothetical protein ABI175_30385, partial [Polyangiales bacterium]
MRRAFFTFVLALVTLVGVLGVTRSARANVAIVRKVSPLPDDANAPFPRASTLELEDAQITYDCQLEPEEDNDYLVCAFEERLRVFQAGAAHEDIV